MKDGLYELPLVNRAAELVAAITEIWLVTALVIVAFSSSSHGQSQSQGQGRDPNANAQPSPSSPAPATTSASPAIIDGGIPKTADNTISLPPPTLSPVDKLTVESTYKDAMLASAEVQRVQAAVLAASSDYQKALVAFQDTVTKYNTLVAKLQESLPKGTVIMIDPATKVASLKPPAPAPDPPKADPPKK